jgi:hypothetical protein
MPAVLAMLTGAILQGAGLAALVFAHHGYAVLVIAVLLMAAGEMIYAPTVSAFSTAIGPISGLALAAGLGSPEPPVQPGPAPAA